MEEISQQLEVETILREHPELGNKLINHYKTEVTYAVSPEIAITGALVCIDPQETVAIIELFLDELDPQTIPEPLSDLVLATHDQSRKPGTWFWTEEQIELANRHPEWIVDLDNMEGTPSPRSLRKEQIIRLGYEIDQNRDEIQAQLQAEGFSTTWTESMENGELIIGFEDPEEEDERTHRLEQSQPTTTAERTPTSQQWPKFSGNRGQRTRKNKKRR